VGIFSPEKRKNISQKELRSISAQVPHLLILENILERHHRRRKLSIVLSETAAQFSVSL
jgi:hypothetical protein